MAGGDQINPGLGEDEGGRIASLDVAGHGRADHFDQRMVAGEHPQRADRRLTQGLGRLAGLIQIDDALGPVGPRLPSARGHDAAHHKVRAEELMVVGGMAGGALEGLPRAENPRQQAPVGDVVIAHDDEARIRHAGDPATRRLKFIGQALLGDVPRDQDEVVRRAMGIVERGGAGMLVFTTEMDVRKLENTPH